MLHSELVKQLDLVDRDEYILNLCEGKVVLHLGCADFPYHEEQYNSNRLLQKKLIDSCDDIEGVDISSEGVAWLKNTFSKGTYHFGNIEDSEYKDSLKNKEFDIILITDVLEHLDNPGMALKNVNDLCKKDSSLVVTVPNAYSVKSFIRVFLGHELIHEGHNFFFSPYVLYRLLKRSGFEVKKFFAYLGGGEGLIANIFNFGVRFFPRLAEGIGVVAIPEKNLIYNNKCKH